MSARELARSQAEHSSAVWKTLPGRLSDGAGRPVRLVLQRVILVSLCCLLCGCGVGDGSSRQSTRGRRIFAANCALCHGQSGEGKPRLGKSLKASGFVAALSDAELVDFLKVGRRADHPQNERGIDMPPRGGNPGLTDEDLEAVVVYLRTLD
jgi:cytochrome c5